MEPAVSPPVADGIGSAVPAAGGEGQEPKVPKRAVRPTEAEVDTHYAAHIPFRSWCPYCVAGKAKSEPHLQSEECTPCDSNIVCMDYAFLGSTKEGAGAVPDTGEESEEEDPSTDETKPKLTVLVMRDRRSKYAASLVVPRKGDHPYTVHAVGTVLRDVLGHKAVILKSDQEPAIKKLRAAVRREHSIEVQEELSAVGNSQSNGEVEITIQQVEGPN
jgi:hypothetical protein